MIGASPSVRVFPHKWKWWHPIRGQMDLCIGPPRPPGIVRSPGRDREKIRRTIAFVKNRFGVCAAAGVLSLVGILATACARPAAQDKTPPLQTAVPVPASVESAASPPNILLLTIDALRRDHLSFYGYHRATTPFLAELAADATVFSRAYSTSSWTVPALASMLTGVYPSTHGAIHGVARQGTTAQQEILSSSLPNLVPILKKAGYKTYAAIANSHIDEAHGFAAGFDRFACLGFEPAGRVTETVRQWVGEISSSTEPVFLWVHFFDPHQPCLAREPQLSELRPDLTLAERHRLAGLTERSAIWGMIFNGGPRELELGLALYDSEIAYCDRQIARLFEALPILDTFLVIMTADHGEEYLDHGDLGHGFNVYDETIGIPLFVRPPGGGPDRTSNQMVSLIDLAPTLASISGAGRAERWQGHRIFGSDGVPNPVPSRELIAELDRFRGLSFSTLIGERSKLIFKHDTETIELYDLAEDPREQSNRAASTSPGQLDSTVRRLKRRLEELRMEAPDPEVVVVEPDTENALKALGYIGN